MEHWEKEFLYKIQRHFFTTSHGKGVVDGTGGSVKGPVHCKILSGRVAQTAKEVAEVALACHTNVAIKYVSVDDITHEYQDTSQYPKMHSIIPTKDMKVKAAEVSTDTFKEYTLSANAKASQSSQNVNVNSSLQGYSTQPSSPVPVQYQVDQWVIAMYEGELFPGGITMVILDQVKVNAMICHGTNLWKWPRKEDHIFYFNHDVKMQNCGLRVSFKIKEMDQTDNL